LGIDRLGGEAIIAYELRDGGPVLLLEMGAVIFLPGSTAGEGDPGPSAVVIKRLVDELAAEPAQAMGRRCRTRCTPPPTRSLRFPKNTSNSTQAVAMSTAQRVQG